MEKLKFIKAVLDGTEVTVEKFLEKTSSSSYLKKCIKKCIEEEVDIMSSNICKEEVINVVSGRLAFKIFNKRHNKDSFIEFERSCKDFLEFENKSSTIKIYLNSECMLDAIPDYKETENEIISMMKSVSEININRKITININSGEGDIDISVDVPYATSISTLQEIFDKINEVSNTKGYASFNVIERSDE